MTVNTAPEDDRKARAILALQDQYGDPCWNCGATNEACLRGLRGLDGAARDGRCCCSTCHATDTHNTEEARLRAVTETKPKATVVSVHAYELTWEGVANVKARIVELPDQHLLSILELDARDGEWHARNDADTFAPNYRLLPTLAAERVRERAAARIDNGLDA